jgi:iron complex outermembrane receptor protein
VDFGGGYQFIAQNRFVFNARLAGTLQHHDNYFGDVEERDRHTNVFAEASVQGASGRHTWVAGAAFERESFDPLNVPRFAYYHRVPGFFAQDDIRWNDWLTVAASARVDVHSTYGTFFSPRVSALVHKSGWTSRLSVGQGFFASSPLTEETEAAGLTLLQMPAPLEAERGTGMSIDVTRTVGAISMTATLFGSRVSHAVEVDRIELYQIGNAERPTTNIGVELLATYRKPPFAVTGNYAFVQAREERGGITVETALTPKHSLGLVGMWERDGIGRVGIEYYFTGEQRLDANPYRDRSERYSILGLLGERQFGRYKAFVNLENMTNMRQTKFDPLVKPVQGPDARWTVDAWAPLDGFALNAGLRVSF